jgi:hypothetical protein
VFTCDTRYFKAKAMFAWWPQKVSDVLPLLNRAQVLILQQCPEALARELAPWVFKTKPFLTPLMDLTPTEKELWQKLDAESCRPRVRKAQKMDCKILLNEEVETARVLLNESIRRMRYREEISRSRWEADLHLHDIFLCKWQDAPMATHVIFRDPPDRVRLLSSGTVDRTDERFRTTVGPCNRLLHWHEFLHYRAKGFRWYDFGGYIHDKNAPDYSIAQFKLSFGPEVVSEPTLWLAKSPAVRALFRGLGATQSAVRQVRWPAAWVQAVKTRPKLAVWFR